MRGESGGRGRAAVAARITVLALLGAGCHVQPDTPLTIAAAAGDTESVLRLLGEGAPIDDQDGTGCTPLVHAARSGHLATIEALLQRGADPQKAAGSNGWSPLVHAVHKGQDAAARLLLEAGASAKDRSGRVALLMAAGYGDAGMVRILIDHGADPGAGEIAPLILAEAVGGAWDLDYPWPGCQAHTDTVRALLAAAPGLRVGTGLRGRMALAAARRHGCVDLVALAEGRNAPAPHGT